MSVACRRPLRQPRKGLARVVPLVDEVAVGSIESLLPQRLLLGANARQGLEAGEPVVLELRPESAKLASALDAAHGRL